MTLNPEINALSPRLSQISRCATRRRLGPDGPTRRRRPQRQAQLAVHRPAGRRSVVDRPPVATTASAVVLDSSAMATSNEPSVLMIGRAHAVMNVLVEELEKFGRVLRVATTEAEIREAMNGRVDLVAMGSGLPDDTRTKMVKVIGSIKPDVAVHLMERTPQSHPRNMIPFVNEMVIDHKLSAVLPPRPVGGPSSS